MNKTLKISFALKNTYRVNSILYSLKQIPLIKKLLPDALYQARGLKVFANVLSILWEIASLFLGKFLYLFFMVQGIGMLYESVPKDRLFLHIFLFLTIIGGFANTALFNPTKDKYYAMILMRMNARDYTVINYTYAMLKVIVGFLPLLILSALSKGLPVWLGLLLPFSVAGCKISISALSLYAYERRGSVYNENLLGKYQWIFILLLLGAAYGLPVFAITLPVRLSAAAMLIFLPAGALGLKKVYSFQDYRAVNQALLAGITNQMDSLTQITKNENQKRISSDTSITSSRKGFEYLNELFIKRHKKILWNATKKISFISIGLICATVIFLSVKPEAKADAGKFLSNSLPYFAFIMYGINRGTGFTQALFINCDHSLLTYSFFRQPKSILRLFWIRLREITKINAVPALIIGSGLALILYVSGGTDNPLNYAVFIVSILCMSIFFSLHYLTIYYLLQPYNAKTEIKSGMYQVISSVTYLCCFYLMRVQMSTLTFGIMAIVFCVAYSMAASVLVYKLAPKTFKIRN